MAVKVRTSPITSATFKPCVWRLRPHAETSRSAPTRRANVTVDEHLSSRKRIWNFRNVVHAVIVHSVIVRPRRSPLNYFLQYFSAVRPVEQRPAEFVHRD